MKTPLESEMFKAGWVRCPNNARRWYAGYAGKLEPAFPMEIHVTDAIWLITYPWGDHGRTVIPLMRFEDVESLENYLVNNGKRSEVAAAYSNSWD